MLKFVGRIDWLLFLPVVILITMGIFMIFSTSVDTEGQITFVIRQFLYGLTGAFLSGIVLFLSYRFFLNFSGLTYFFLLIILIITFVLGIESRGSTRWIDLGFFTLQGSEIAKPILILGLAAFLTRFSPKKFLNIIISLILMLIPAMLVFLQPDLGSAIIIGLIWIGLVYIAGIKLRYFLMLMGIGLVALPIGFSFLKDYQKERILSFLNPSADPLGSGYNVVQSIIAVGSGQLFGRGFGRGTQSHLNFLPEQKTDFIFATTAEELGFIGVLVILILFAVIIWRLLVIGGSSRDKAGAMICYGAALVIAAQLFINAGMNMGLLPVTGITLPFVSFGGSSLISMILLVALAESVHLQRRYDL